jgi:hypothetical protein
MKRHCKMCGKEITDELSRERGYGPVCYEKHLEDVKKLQTMLKFVPEPRLRPDMNHVDKQRFINKLLYGQSSQR